MSTKPPAKSGKGGGKAFLTDDNLQGELDQWDSMFDSLHEEATGIELAPEPVMDWPAAASEPEPTMLNTPAAPADDATLDVPDAMFGAEPDLDEQLTLDRVPQEESADDTADRAAPAPRAPTHLPVESFDPAETDFSEMGASGQPAALGQILGRGTTNPGAPPRRGPNDDEPVDADATRVDLMSTRGRAPTRPPAVEDDDDDDEVFTSASRPAIPAAPHETGWNDDSVAPPPAPAPEPRRTAAIVRRGPPATAGAKPVAGREQKPTPSRGVAASKMAEFSEETRILDSSELESSRQASKTLPPPIGVAIGAAAYPDEDDEYEIEIGASSDSKPVLTVDEPAPRTATRTAHTVRRSENTKAPPLSQQSQSISVPSISALGGRAEPVAVAAPPEEPAEQAEDDFSDVAAAVGADESNDMLIEVPTPTPPPGPLPTLPAVVPRATPPAGVELYSRIKTPTSVPPLGAHGFEIGAREVPEIGDKRSSAPRVPRLQSSIPVEVEAPDPEPTITLDASVKAWPEQAAPIASSSLDEAAAQSLQIYERELSTLDESSATAALRIEAGRLSERLGETDRARTHYDAALLADPRATAALRGLRRLARAAGDLTEAVRHLDAEIAVAAALERRPLGHYRIDLLMASNDQDLARVAVGEILDNAPSDVRALLAQLELAFVDGRADEFGSALEQLAHAVTDPALRAAVQSARGALAAHHNDVQGAANYFAAAAESDPTSIAARIGAVRHAAAQADGELAAKALIDLARQLEPVDRITAAAAAVRAQQWTGGAVGASAAALASAAAPGDPLVARLAAEAVSAATDPAAAAAFAHWASTGTSGAERAYAASRAAELDPTRGTELWSAALEHDPGDDYAAAQLRTAHVAAEATEHAIGVDLIVANDMERERARLRAAYGLIAQGQLDNAIDILRKGRDARPSSLALAEALGEALAAAGRWTDRAKLYAELAANPGEQLDGDVALLRSALAWEEAVGAVAASLDNAEGRDDEGELKAATSSALQAWEKVLESNASGSPEAHAAAIVLASRLGDRDVMSEVLQRAQGSERSPWAAASLALRRARSFFDDPGRAESILREPFGTLDDPRRTVALISIAARGKELGDAAQALEERANLLDSTNAVGEVAALRLRAAQLALDANDAMRATALLGKVEIALPQLGVVPDLLAAARRRAGDRPMSGPIRVIGTDAPPTTGPAAADAFARIVRDADLAASQGDGAGAVALYQRALELRPADPLAAVPLVRTASALGDPDPIAGLAIAQLRAAEEAADGVAKAAAYELLAHIDGDLRSDSESAQIALESAAEADPSRIDLKHRLERGYASANQLAELIKLRKAAVDLIPVEHTKDRAALLADLASLATRDKRPELEIADLHRRVLEVDPRRRLALMHLEAIVRRAGFSDELAQLEEQIATYFEGDPKTQAAFWTRAGETLAEIEKIDEAVLRFGKADAAFPGHIPALEAWRQAALKGQLWIDVAEAANRQAAVAETTQKAKLYHFAGVALMDKALVGEQAMIAFRKALEADAKHKDSFLRLRILLEEDANHDDLALLLDQRLAVEPPGPAKTELHRALAELSRNFLSDRDKAKEHYRAILEVDPNDLRAHAAIADIAWELGHWQEAADALVSRARLERQPDILKTLCFRLGLIYADRLVDVPMALKAFQRALTYQPDDENTLVRLADLATQAGEWKLALGACERLVKNEEDPDHRASHLHRVAKIFREGFNDAKRAERALNLALDGAPTNDDALTQLVDFYKSQHDTVSMRVHLNRLAGQMRTRAAQHPKDGVTYRVIARAMVARDAAGVDGSKVVARAAAELADLLGEGGEPEQKLLREQPRPHLDVLVRPEADEILFPRGVPTELRQIFQLLGDRVAKHVGVDLRPYGVTRGDRLRAKDNATASVAQSIANGLGFGEIDVFVSSKQPYAMVAEPTSPVSLVLGSSVAQAGGDAIKFAAGSALKLAHASLSIPARLSPDELGVLVVALLRVMVPDFPADGVDGDQVHTHTNKLKRLIPTNLMNELRPYAQQIDGARLDLRAVSRDLRVAGARAGLIAAGSVLPGLRLLAAEAQGDGADVKAFLSDPLAQGLISFAVGEDHSALAR